jgi:4-hydroxybenzoate polyprenyltransferase
METLARERPEAVPEPAQPPARPRSTARALLAEMRPGEWVKNVLVFAGLVFGKKFHDSGAIADAVLTFVAFCAIASAGYLFNDLRDAELDRQHPEKRRRPIASGELTARAAVTAAVALAAAGIALAAATVSLEAGGLVALYGAVTVVYSVILKRLVIIDVMTIASLFILRVVAGAVAVDAHASQYLLVCTGMLALFLGFTKRRQEAILETRQAAGTAPVTRPVLEHYSVPFLDQMVSMVTAAAILSYILYAVNSPIIGSRMLATAPSVLYGIFRYLYLIYDREDTRSTASILAHDPGIIFAGVSWIVTAVIMLYAVG